MSIRTEVLPFLGIALLFSLFIGITAGFFSSILWGLASGAITGTIICGFLLFFFRDPTRNTDAESQYIVSPADGKIAALDTLSDKEFSRIAQHCGMNETKLKEFFGGHIIRVSIFLSLFNVHVNRSPISGYSEFLGYFPGKRLFTFMKKSSDVNQHNSIFMINNQICCLLNQIVGPVCRRVVYWPDPHRKVWLNVGDKIGMMKFGSRMDMYFPENDVIILSKIGDKVKAGISTIAQITVEEHIESIYKK